MSIVVELSELGAAVVQRPWAYLLTVGPDLDVHVLAVAATYEGRAFRLHTGSTSKANAASRPEVTLVFPPSGAAGIDAMSLIVDGSATVHDGGLEVTPRGAVWHRAAPTT